MDDEKRRPDGPTEPPDQRMGTRQRGGKSRVKSEGSRSSRADGLGTGDSSVEACRPGKPDEQPNKAERSAMCQNASIEGERLGGSVLAQQGRSTRTDEENDQRNKTIIEDVPSATPELPPPVPIPDKPAQPLNETPSVELEGESGTDPSCEVGLTTNEADALGVPGHTEDSRNVPKKARNASEHERESSEQDEEKNSPDGAKIDPSDPRDEADASPVQRTVEDVGRSLKNLHNALKCVRKHSEPKEEMNSPSRPQEEPYDPGGETAIPGGIHNVQERPEGVRNERVDGTDAPSRDTDPGRDLELQGESEVIEGDPDRAIVVDSAEYDGTHPRSDGSTRVVETNAPCRDNRLGGHIGERGGPGDAEGDWERLSDGEGIEMDRTGCQMDGATSGARCESKRLESHSLAVERVSQHERRNRTTDDAPRPSTPLPNDPKRPMDHPNPPRRRGKTKTRPRNISNPRWTYQATQTRRGRIGRIERAGYVAYGPEMVGERHRAAKREDGSAGIDRGRVCALGQQRDHLPSRDLPYRAIARAQRRDHSHRTSYGLEYHSFINHLVYIHLILPFTYIKHLQSFSYPFVFEGECWNLLFRIW